MRDRILEIILIIPAILVAFTFHEYAHARVADALGDKTPRFQGRLTLNPFAHIDTFGFLMILLFKFGWAKPVQVNKKAFKNYYKDDLKVSIAGPIANLLVGFVFSIIYGLFFKFYAINNINLVTQIVATILNFIILINVNLFIFNLLPLPGLDGFHIMEDLFPKSFYKFADQIYRYQFLIFIIVIYVGSAFIRIPSSFIYGLFMKIAQSIIMM
ncbi:metalloprotease [Clostridium polyendosporum]|uniref:Metalloprotease n=1 Tax=Clostridium polyendosporum TaxID=69208 RepID=A0A919S2S4_9CLOT|nr:site-2 protease family protein [Clostridium polyendosporum]GIM30311.1 metalloprotease [Clostridium polyendosporum]